MSTLAAVRELRSFLRLHGLRGADPAVAALEALSTLVAADCLAVSMWDAAAGGHHTLASSYPGETMAFFDGGMHVDPLFLDVRRSGVPTRVQDIEPSRRWGSIFDRVVIPGGFHDGVTHCLVSADGRYVGMVNASTSSSVGVEDDVVLLLELLGHDLAAAMDPVTPATSLLSRLDDGLTQGFLVTPMGGVETVSGGACPDLLHRVPDLAAVVCRSGRVDGVDHLLVIDGTDLYAIDACRTARGTVVLHRRTDPPVGLSPRELQVLEGLGRGLTNDEIGGELHIGNRTVATYVERILVKIGVRNRVGAASQAARWGLCRSGVT